MNFDENFGEYIAYFIESTFNQAVNIEALMVAVRASEQSLPAAPAAPPCIDLDEIAPCETHNNTKHNIPYKQPSCSICLEKYTPESKVRRLPCNHVFHAKCIDTWVNTKNECALCKKCLLN